MKRSILMAVPLFLLLAAYLGINMTGHGLWPADEPRYGQVAREMMQSGDYLVPRVNGEPYLEKPPLLFWSIALASLPAGDVTPVTARIPSWLAALLTTVLTWMLARRMFGGRVALWSVVMMVTAYRFWWQAGFAQIDMLLTGCMTVVLYHLWRWEEDRRAWRLPVIYGAMAAGMLAKGPPALIFPLLLIFSFHWRDKPGRKALHWAAGCTAALAVAALWYVPARLALDGEGVRAVSEGIGGNLIRNTVGRALMGVSKAQPPWYYLLQFPTDWLPWSLFLPWIAFRAWRLRRETKAHRFLWCWFAPAFVFFSISIGKRAIYLLPLFPAAAIFTAMTLLELMDGGRARWRRAAGLVWAVLLLLAGLAVHALPFTEYGDLYTAGPVLLSAAALAAAVVSFVYALRTDCRRLHALMAATAALLYAGASQLVFPAMDAYKSAERICAPVRALSERGADFDLYCLGFSREEYIFYSGRFHEPVLADIVGRDTIPPEKLAEAARAQGRARSAIAKAAAAVAVADGAEPTREERARLLEAVHRAVAGEEERNAGVLQFEDDLRREVDAFARRLTDGRPAFFFVQEGDWRWLSAFFPGDTPVRRLNLRMVGTRRTLLMANAPGEELLRREKIPHVTQ